MIVRRNLSIKQILHYTWKDLIYYTVLSISVVILHNYFGLIEIQIPDYTLSALSVALSIFLGFKNDQAYDRWWEARKIWGLMVNYSRSWTRQATTFILPKSDDEKDEVKLFQTILVYRHIAFVNALRVFLRKRHKYNELGIKELYEVPNSYEDVRPFLNQEEYESFLKQDNPPNFLLQNQGDDLQKAFKRGWLSDFRFVKMEETLVDFNDIQGMSERIKNTPLPRQFTFYSRVFVLIHCSMLPFVFINELDWMTVPLALSVSFVFTSLDILSERTEDPFENKLEDTPLTSLSVTIETNLREQLRESKDKFPVKPEPIEGVVL